MARRGVFSSMSLMQATITFMIAFLAVNVLIDVFVFGREPVANIQGHVIFAVLLAPLWYFFVRWMRSRNA